MLFADLILPTPTLLYKLSPHFYLFNSNILLIYLFPIENLHINIDNAAELMDLVTWLSSATPTKSS